MKGFLFDENVPLPLRFVPSLPVIHATSLGESPSDTDLWQYATQNELVIVSKDADFVDRIMAATPPPWFIHLRFGNRRRVEFDTLLANAWPHIETILPTHKMIRVYADRVETVRD